MSVREQQADMHLADLHSALSIYLATFLERPTRESSELDPGDVVPGRPPRRALALVPTKHAYNRLGWNGERRLSWFLCPSVTLPALVLQLDMLNSDSIGIGIQIRESLKFRDPAPIDFV